MSTAYATPTGFTDKRPANYPAIDRSALMRDAHQIAKASRAHFASYAEAFAYGLRSAWLSVKSRRTIFARSQSKLVRAPRPSPPRRSRPVATLRAAADRLYGRIEHERHPPRCRQPDHRRAKPRAGEGP